MSRPGLLPLAQLFGGLSLISVGGANVLFPSIRHAVVEQHGWLGASDFARLFALSQAAPGPNVMLASIVGWQMLGLAGLAVATLAILLPSSLLALMVGRVVQRGDRAWLAVATAALVPLALGLMLASGIVAVGTSGGALVGDAIAAAAALVVLGTRINPLLVMAAGTALYLALHGLPPG